MRPVHPLSSEDAIDVQVRVIPRAKRDAVGGERAGRLLVRTTASPIDEQANEAVCRAIARHFGVPRRRVELLAGRRSRDKTVRVKQVARTERLAKLAGSAAPASE